MEDDTEQSVVKKESVDNDKGERVIKLSLGKLIKSNEHIDKPLLIGVIEQYILKNSELFTRLGIIMHLIVMCYVQENRSLPPKFCDEEFIAHAANWFGWRNQLHPLCSLLRSRKNNLLPHRPTLHLLSIALMRMIAKRKIFQGCIFQKKYQFLNVANRARQKNCDAR